jgi:hypothetical protein
LKVTILRKNSVLKDFPIIEKFLILPPRGEFTTFGRNEKRRVKTLPHVASRSTTRKMKRIRIIYENEIFINEERVWRRLLFWIQRYSQRFTEV